MKRAKKNVVVRYRTHPICLWLMLIGMGTSFLQGGLLYLIYEGKADLNKEGKIHDDRGFFAKAGETALDILPAGLFKF